MLFYCLARLISIIGNCTDYGLNLPSEYTIDFNPLWNDSEKEIAETEKLKADAELAKANTAKTYIEIGALDATKVRNRLDKESYFKIDASLDGTLQVEYVT